MKRARQLSSTSLAFIDVMACGLGAVILLFFLLDFRFVVEVPEVIEVEDVSELDVSGLKATRASLATSLAEVKSAISSLKKELTARIIDVAKAMSKPLPKEVTRPPAPKPVKRRRPSGDLIGLQVKGERILVLLDTSASMAYENLIDIIVGISDKSGRKLANGPKWSQAKKTVSWLLDNAPESSYVKIVRYSDQTSDLTSGWQPIEVAAKEFGNGIGAVKPHGGTSLGTVLEHVSRLQQKPTNIYVVTDGLPTLPGDKKGLSISVRKCASNAKRNSYVSGDCRETFFVAAVERFAPKSTASLNIVLLPLEGDPRAAPLYSQWTYLSGGVMFSPSREWPP